jgi:hypothetical protein
MRRDPDHVRSATRARDLATGRLRQLTLGAAALAVAGAGGLAAYAASSTHGRKSIRVAAATTQVRPVHGVPPVPAPTATVTIDAPAMAPAPAPSPQPVASAAPPVVVSGGS